MKSETLQLFGKLDEASAMNLARFLGSVRGVAKVAVATSTASVNVDFDEDITSLQELFARLQWAGVRVNVPAHGEEGMCCGSCG